MAVMFPSSPRHYEPNSREDEVFYALRDHLPDDYFVYHSFKQKFVNGERQYGSEIDFVIFHPKKGILCLEVKNSAVTQDKNGYWHYSNKTTTESPFEQAEGEKRYLQKEYLGVRLDKTTAGKLRYHSAVWLLQYSKRNKPAVVETAETTGAQILFEEDLQNPLPAIESIFKIRYGSKERLCLNLSEKEIVQIRKHLTPQTGYGDRCPLLAPYYDGGMDAYRKPVDCKLTETEISSIKNCLAQRNAIRELPGDEAKRKKREFVQLLAEQKRILDFITESPYTIIKGAAGTGKTFIAMEHAYRKSEEGEKTLYICRNTELRDYLKGEYENDSERSQDAELKKNITILTYLDLRHPELWIPDYGDYEPGKKYSIRDISGITDSGKFSAAFPYTNIIIDEAQDFQEGCETEGIICKLIDIVCYEKLGHALVFYDPLQSVQATKLAAFVTNTGDLTAHLSLTKNYRNTAAIANTAFSVVIPRSADLDSKRRRDHFRKTLSEGLVEGITPFFHVSRDKADCRYRVDQIIQRIKDEHKIENIVILTCKTEKTSALGEFVKGNFYTSKGSNEKYPFYTISTFKGLDAEAVIMTDVSEKTFGEDLKAEYYPNDYRRFYVGASRAKQILNIVCCFEGKDERLKKDVIEILESLKIKNIDTKSPFDGLAKATKSDRVVEFAARKKK